MFGLLLLGALAIGAIEFAHSDFVLNSKTYELIGYQEVSRQSAGDEIHVHKQKRWCCLPGETHLVFVQNAAGQTLERHVPVAEASLSASDDTVTPAPPAAHAEVSY
jgi:hypothetical protein